MHGLELGFRLEVRHELGLRLEVRNELGLRLVFGLRPMLTISPFAGKRVQRAVLEFGHVQEWYRLPGGGKPAYRLERNIRERRESDREKEEES